MNLNIIIIEDQPEECERLKNELNNWSQEHTFQTTIFSYPSGEAYFSAHQEHTAHLFFLDIQLGGMNGLEIAQRLRAHGYKGEIIFLTAFREYVFEGYQVHALNYLLKPIQASALYPCMNEVANTFMGNSYIFRNKQEIIQIPYHDILVFTSNLHYVDILTFCGSFCQYTSLNNVLDYLPKEFIRTHRSYIVNMAHILKIVGNTITLSNNMTVQIGRQYLNNVRTAFSEYSLRFDKQ